MALNPYLTQYFSRMTDPKFQQAQQQQNLFSALTRLGGGLMAAGAPTTQPGQGQRVFGSAMANFGKDLAGSNQNMQNQLMNAIKLKSVMTKNQIAQNKIDARKNLANKFALGSKEEAAILAGIPLSSVGVLTGRPAAKIQVDQYLQELEKKYPPIKDVETNEMVDHPMVARFKKQINPPQNIIKLGDRTITVKLGIRNVQTLKLGINSVRSKLLSLL